jgi:DNA-binding MarR family transcriptional regulator
MGRPARQSAPKGADRDIGEQGVSGLDLSALYQTPGFMIRVLQIQIFERFFNHFADQKISPVEYAILVTVRDNPTMTQSELAAVLKMKLPNLVNILSKMEAARILRRRRSAKDRRAIELSLTQSGQSKTSQAAALGDLFNAQTLAALSKHEQAAFLQMLGRLLEAPKIGPA